MDIVRRCSTEGTEVQNHLWRAPLKSGVKCEKEDTVLLDKLDPAQSINYIYELSNMEKKIRYLN